MIRLQFFTCCLEANNTINNGTSFETLKTHTSESCEQYMWNILWIMTNSFNIHESVHRNNILIQNSQQDAHVTVFILSDDCSTCFGYHYHPFQEHKTTVTTASGNHYTVLLSVAIVEELELI
jgi:hypothetical protein